MVEGIKWQLKRYMSSRLNPFRQSTAVLYIIIIFFYSYEGGPEMDEAAEI